MNIIKYFVSISLTFLLLSCANNLNSSKEANKPIGLPSNVFIFNDKGKANYYTFDLIKKKSKINTVVFFISGSGCSSVKSRFPSYLEPLIGTPATVYILQKRGIIDGHAGNKCSKEFVLTDYFEKTLKDQKEFISKKLATSLSKYTNIVLIGASEGSVVASKIAESNSKITHLGLIGSGGASLRKDLEILSRKQLLFSFTFKRNIRSIEKYPNSFTKTAWGHSYKYWSSILDVDLRKILPKLNIPITIAMGENDKSVPIESLKELKQIFKQQGKNNLIVKIYPGADHRLFSTSSSISYAPDFLRTLKSQL